MNKFIKDKTGKEKCKGNAKKTIVKVSNSDIISSVKQRATIDEMKIQKLGRINIKLLEKKFSKIQTDEIIITNERIGHIKTRHPEDYELFKKYGTSCVQSPDLIISDEKNKGTVFMVKKLPETNLNVIVRVVLEEDDNSLKNSVMTFYRIRDKNLKKLIDKNELLYKNE